MYTISAAATILSLAAFLHLLRIVLWWDLFLAEWFIPFWVSGLAVIIAGYLAVQLWMRK